MARPRVADGGHGLNPLRVGANLLHKQSRTASKGWSSILEFRQGVITFYRKKLRCYEMFFRASKVNGFFETA
jgi:hypothetical protein